MPPIIPPKRISEVKIERPTTLDDIYKYQEKVFQLASAYVNVVLLGGYALFFSFWAFGQNQFSDFIVVWSGTLVASSLFLFLLFEVLKILYISLDQLILNRALRSGTPKSQMLEKGIRLEKRVQFVLVGMWVMIFPTSAILAFSGGGLLLFAFFQKLWIV